MTAAPTAAAHAEVAFQTGKKWIELLPWIKLMPPTSFPLAPIPAKQRPHAEDSRMSAAKKQKTAKARCAIVTTTIYVRTFTDFACREQC